VDAGPATLFDGTKTLLRPVRITDEQPLQRMLYALSDESGASCEAVSRALRAANFPLPATLEKTPTILLQPPSE
jgi:hypothetical protein